MRLSLDRRLKRLEGFAGVNEPVIEHIINFVDADGTVSGTMVLRVDHGLTWRQRIAGRSCAPVASEQPTNNEMRGDIDTISASCLLHREAIARPKRA